MGREKFDAGKPIIKWPQGEKVTIPSAVDFVYVMRKDNKFTMSPIAASVARDYSLDEAQTRQTLIAEYDTFFSKLTDSFIRSFASKGNFEIHLYDPAQLEAKTRRKSADKPIVSLDPLIHDDVFSLHIARGYYPGGTNDYGSTARPGSKDLPEQAQLVAQKLNNGSVVLIDDDAFSGGSLARTVAQLQRESVAVDKIIPAIQIGKPGSFIDIGTKSDSVVEYQTENGEKIFDKVDLGDPRDFLIGTSGLVVKLPNGETGRAPYLLPFVSPSARASIPEENEKEFTQRVLMANREFFLAAADKIGHDILLRHMDPDFVKFMHTMYGFADSTRMDHIVTWAITNNDRLWERTKTWGELHEKIDNLQLPQNIVFVDINGTLLPHDSDGTIADEKIDELKDTILSANEKGIEVGLCSDSPLPQLRQFADKLGFTGPIIAENGNIIHFNNKTVIVNPLPNRETYMQQIAGIASEFDYEQSKDCIAPEFGGEPLDMYDNRWGFGAGREASVTVFGPPELIEKLGEVIPAGKDISRDCSPQYHFFAIHPGADYKKNKGKTLHMLSTLGHNVIMVGDSMSDWADPKTGVQCSFVANAEISDEAASSAKMIARAPFIDGVNEIINSIR